MAYYRLYRPQTIDELDNKNVRELLSRNLSQKTLPHAYLFTGPKGVGKTSAARIVAKSLNCTKTPGNACGKCESCRSIADGNNLDVLEIDAASNRGIDEIRQLREGIKFAPVGSAYKVYIIDEVHMLTTEAFNALLKTLEEPPQHAVFILATTELHKVPETIVSRCVGISFTAATSDELFHSLARIVKGEKLSIDDAALQLIASVADGSFRDGAKLLEQAAARGGTITTEIIEEQVGARGADIGTFLELLHDGKTKELLALIAQIHRAGGNIRVFVKMLLIRLEQLLIAYFDNPKASTWTIGDIRRAIGILSSAWEQYRFALVPTLPLELAVVEYGQKDLAVQPSAHTSGKTSFTPATASTAVTSSKSAGIVSTSWDAILDAIKPHNNSLVGVLRSCKPVEFEGGVVTIESPYKFHSDRINEPKIRDLVAKVISDVIGSQVSIKIILKSV